MSVAMSADEARRMEEAYSDLEGGVADAKNAAAVAVEMFHRAFAGNGNCEMARTIKQRLPGLDRDLRVFLVSESMLEACLYALANAQAEVGRVFDAYHAGFEEKGGPPG